MAELTVREWQAKYNAGEFSSADVEVQCNAGWYDWFCKNSSLRNKTIRMGNIIKHITNEGKVNLDTMYVWFKNNCPMSGGLYDDFRFADIETGETQLTIAIGQPKSWNEEMYAVYCHGHWDMPIFKTNSSNELVAWLNTSNELPNNFRFKHYSGAEYTAAKTPDGRYLVTSETVSVYYSEEEVKKNIKMTVWEIIK